MIGLHEYVRGRLAVGVLPIGDGLVHIVARLSDDDGETWTKVVLGEDLGDGNIRVRAIPLQHADAHVEDWIARTALAASSQPSVDEV